MPSLDLAALRAALVDALRNLDAEATTRVDAKRLIRLHVPALLDDLADVQQEQVELRLLWRRLHDAVDHLLTEHCVAEDDPQAGVHIAEANKALDQLAIALGIE